MTTPEPMSKPVDPCDLMTPEQRDWLNKHVFIRTPEQMAQPVVFARVEEEAPKPVELTEAEHTNLGAYADGTYSCASEDDCNGYDDNRPGHMHENLYDCVTNIVKARMADAWDEGWNAHGDHVTAVRRWNDSEGDTTDPNLHTRNSYRVTEEPS